MQQRIEPIARGRALRVANRLADDSRVLQVRPWLAGRSADHAADQVDSNTITGSARALR